MTDRLLPHLRRMKPIISRQERQDGYTFVFSMESSGRTHVDVTSGKESYHAILDDPTESAMENFKIRFCADEGYRKQLQA